MAARIGYRGLKNPWHAYPKRVPTVTWIHGLTQMKFPVYLRACNSKTTEPS